MIIKTFTSKSSCINYISTVKYFLFSFALLGLWHCMGIKETYVSGYVLRLDDGAPLKGYSVSIAGYKGYHPDSSIPKAEALDHAVSDSTGFYSVSVEGKFDLVSFELVTGYCNTHLGIKADQAIEIGTANKIDLKADVIDGQVCFIATNKSGANAVKTNVRVLCKRNGEGAACCYASLNKASVLGQIDTLKVDVSAGRNISFFWDNQPITNSNPGKSGSVFCPRDGKTYFNIDY